MKNNLKIVIAIVVAVILAAAFPFLIWKFTSHNGAIHSAGNGDGQYLDRKQLAFAGYATPEATLQSMFLAANNGDGDQLFACFSPEGQAAIGKEPNGRKNFDAGVKKNAQAQSIKGLQITARKVLAENGNSALKPKITRRIGTTAASPSRRLRERIGFCAQTILVPMPAP